jgi:hypothetical protein
MIIIDPGGRFHRDQVPAAYDTLEQAKAAYPDHEWVWLCCNGSIILDDFEHPQGDVIYAFGANVDGAGPEFDDEVGPKVRLRSPEVVWDYTAALLTLNDRELKLGRA